MSPYVGMARKQNGGYNASISVQRLIFPLVVNSTRLKTVRSALWRCSNSTVALRLLENVVKVTNQEVVKIEFRHLPFLILLTYKTSSFTMLLPWLTFYLILWKCKMHMNTVGYVAIAYILIRFLKAFNIILQ